MTENLLLTFNAGSSTLEIGICEVDSHKPQRIGQAVVDFSSKPRRLHLKEGPAQFDLPLSGNASNDLSKLMNEVFEELGARFDLDRVKAAGHRVVHGGDNFSGPTALTDAIEQIRSLKELARSTSRRRCA